MPQSFQAIHARPLDIRPLSQGLRRGLLRRIGQQKDGDSPPFRPAAEHVPNIRAGVGRKIERRHHHVHHILLQPANGFIQIRGLDDLIALHVQTAPDQAARECRGLGNQNPFAAGGPDRALEPISGSGLNHVVEIQEIRDSLATTAEPSRPLRADFCRTVTASSATPRIWSTTSPTLRSPSLKTTT